MNTQRPLVSIVLPTYNGAHRIERAIQSVLAQTYASWELLVIDDGSTDGTRDAVSLFAADPRVRYVRNEANLGIQKTLNRGLALSHGSYVARIDDDDSWIDPAKLERQVSFLEGHPEHVLVGTGVVVLDESGTERSRYTPPLEDGEIRGRILGQNCFAHASVLFAKERVVARGGYDTTRSARHSEDYELWLYLGTVGKFANLDIPAVALVSRSGSLTEKHRIIQAWRALMISLRYAHAYPNRVKGVSLATIRLLFFCVRPLLLFLPESMLHRLKSFIKRKR